MRPPSRGIAPQRSNHSASTTNYEWAYEMQIADPDGNVLRIGSEPKPNEPFGEWLDMHGGRWAQSPGGEWTRVDER